MENFNSALVEFWKKCVENHMDTNNMKVFIEVVYALLS